MGWRAYSLFCLFCWSIYAIFGNRATAVHGPKISLIFEALGFLILAMLAGVTGGLHDFSKITPASCVNAVLMAVASASGFYFLLQAFSAASDRDAPLIVMITGAYPMVTVVLMRLHGTHLTGIKWVGVGIVAVGLLLLNWPDKVNSKTANPSSQL